ncbi:MAG: hypothetical protein ACYDD4_11420 [Acidimicrobiales bacterium]
MNERISRTWIWVLGLSLAFVASGMAYSLLWPWLVRHNGHYWIQPGDLWSTWKDAQWIGWGGGSYVYNTNSGLVTLPGFALVLAPFTILASHLGLSMSTTYAAVPKATAWLMLGPLSMAMVAAPLAGFDGLARQLGIDRTRRRVLMVAVAGSMWPAVVWWGHPEDVLAIGLLALTFTRVLQGRTTSAGWLLGAALATQLFALLLVPLLLGILGVRKGAALLARASLAPGFLAVAILAHDFSHAWPALWHQPNYPTVDHATPWVLLAPKIAPHVVAAGPGRIVAMLLAVTVGVVATRRRADPVMLVWLAALSMAGRSLFEAVMVPYYVMPLVAFVLLAAAAANRLRMAAAVAVSAALSVVVFFHYGMWMYWFAMAGPATALLAMTHPARTVVHVPARLLQMRPTLENSGFELEAALAAGRRAGLRH